MTARPGQPMVPCWMLALLLLVPLAGCGPSIGPIDVPLPKLVTAGWIGGPPPVAADLRGNVVVIDCWASW